MTSLCVRCAAVIVHAYTYGLHVIHVTKLSMSVHRVSGLINEKPDHPTSLAGHFGKKADGLMSNGRSLSGLASMRAYKEGDTRWLVVYK